MRVLNEAAQWVVDRGADGWRPGQWRQERLREAIERGETFLARRDGVIVGTVSLQWADETVWSGWPEDAGYVHRLAVATRSHGQGVGRGLIEWTEQATRERGRRFLRLDCACGNPELRAYYESLGFHPRGEVTLVRPTITYCAARYEKDLAGDGVPA